MTYKSFSKYVVRVPLFSFSFYKKLTEKTEIKEEELKEVCENPKIKEAIFLASPSLYQEFDKWLKGTVKETVAVENIVYSVLKYLSRMSSRCTPFGLFAGTAVGEFSDHTAIEFSGDTSNNRHTRLDMNYLVALSQDIIKNQTIREQLLFYPNTSIYRAGKQLRYVEYTYLESRRVHHIIAVEDSEYLQQILSQAKNGISLHNAALSIVDEEITIEEARGFINQLVESQLLISELEPSVSGPEFLDQLVPVLRKITGTESILLALENVQQTLQNIDQNIGNSPDVYIQLSESLKKLETGFDLKYMFQTDMSLSLQKNTINVETLRKIKKGVSILNKISLPAKETLISQFGNALHERYENREVPLSKALDVELGIGFVQNNDTGDVSEIVDDLILPFKEEKIRVKEIKWSPIHAIFHKKLIECFNKDQRTLVLKDKDFLDFEENWEDLPDTISTMVELVHIDGVEKIVMSSCGA